MSILTDAYSASSDLQLWSKVVSNQSLFLSDIPELIPLRWPYFRDQWEFIVDNIKSQINTYLYPDVLSRQITDFNDFVKVQRALNKTNINPFIDANTRLRFFAIFDVVSINVIPLTKNENDIITKNKDRVNAFIRTDFITMRDKLINAMDYLADIVGQSDDDYDTIMRRQSAPKQRNIKIVDVKEMQKIQNAVRVVDFVLANIYSLPTTSVDPFALAKQNANNPDYNIQTGLSGQLVPMYYGDTLASLAQRYLGDPDRWIEIAIANGLKPPYIDEVGQSIKLNVNGNQNQVNLLNVDSNLFYVNQIVLISSDNLRNPEQRTVKNIKHVIYNNEIILELSGDADLSKYTTSDNAIITIFTPNTINSSFFVMIPNSQPIQNVSQDPPWFLQSKKEDEKRAQVDLLLTNDMDLAFTANNDLQLSFGLANAIQAVKLKIAIERGSLRRHPNFGLVAIQGQKSVNADSVKSALITSIISSISTDSRFSRVESISADFVKTSGTSGFLITLVVRLAGTGTLLPINFRISA